MRSVTISLLATLAIFTIGCQSPNSKSGYLLSGNSVSTEVKRFNRQAKLYRQFDTALIVDAIYYDDSLRVTLLEQMAVAKTMTGDEKKRAKKEMEQESQDMAVFYVAIYTPDEDAKKLIAPRPAWSISLNNEDKVFNPTSIIKVEPYQTPWHEAFPFDPIFRSIYRVDFSRKSAGHGPFALNFKSSHGEINLGWNGK